MSSSSMSIEAICNNKMKKALSSFGEEVARSVIEYLSSKYGFSLEEALSSYSLRVCDKREKSTRGERESRPSSRVSTRRSALPSLVPLPFCGKAVDGWCSGIRPNGGLYTQCSNEPDGDLPYCATCQRQATKNGHGLPNGGDIGERIAKGDDWRCPKGKEPVRLANYLKKSGKVLTDELRAEINASAERFGWTIADTEWVVKSGSRGRPRKTKTAVVDTTATEDEGEKCSPGKKTSRKVKKTNSGSELENASDSSDGEELVLAPPKNSSLMKRRSVSPPSPAPVVVDESGKISPIVGDDAVSISPVEVKETPKSKKQRKPKMSPEEKEAAKAAKAAAKLAEKEAAKAAKAAEREAAKAAKAAAKLAEKEAAKAAKAEEKRLKKEAVKAAKAAEREAAKAAKAEEKRLKKEAAKQAEKDAKIAEQAAANAAKIEEQLFGPPSPSDEESDDEGAHKRCAHTDSNGKRCSTPSEGDGNLLCTKHSSTPSPVPEDPEHDVYEAETEDEDDSDDEAAGVEEFDHKGKKYLRDPKTNDIFDHAVFMDTSEAEQIGVYNPETDEIEFYDDE